MLFRSSSPHSDGRGREFWNLLATQTAWAGDVTWSSAFKSGWGIDPGCATRGAARPPTEIGQLVGRWIDPKSGQSFELSADGTYRTPTGGTGKAAPTAEGLLFTGVFAAWNDGRATVTADLRVIEFRWSNKDGSRSYFAFLRAGGSPGPGR